jgi:hypothetical protein
VVRLGRFTPSRFVLGCAIMTDSILSKHLRELGRKGGKARLKWTAEERKASARKAGEASAAARKRKAKEKKKT